MRKNRLEAFSDGVFAIVITLLILNVRLPDVAYYDLPGSLVGLIPVLAAYVVTFLLIGMYWVFHHYRFSFIAQVDGVLLWLNIIFLLSVSFLPFPTMMLGKYPFQTLPIVIYCVNLMLINLIGLISILYVKNNKHLVSPDIDLKSYKEQRGTYIWVNGLYLFCIFLAYYAPKVAVYVLLVMALALIIRSALFMRLENKHINTSQEHN